MDSWPCLGCRWSFVTVKPGGALGKKALEHLQRRQAGRRGRHRRNPAAAQQPKLAPHGPALPASSAPEGRRCSLCLLRQPLKPQLFMCVWPQPKQLIK